MIPPPDLRQTVALKAAIWLYFSLLIFEGALRKWILPGYSDVLFIVRDPVVIAIYLLALQSRMFPFRPALIALGLIVFCSALFSVFSDAPPMVTLFGLRTNYLHLPLVFIMAQTMDRSDVIRFGKAVMILAIPIFVIMLVQFQSAPDSWINSGVGGSNNGQIRGALGKIRPPGPFSFIDGVVSFFGLLAAFVYHGWIKSGVYPRRILLLATLALIFAVPISISRSLLMGVLIVFVFGVTASFRNLKTAPRHLLLPVLACACLALISQTVYLKAFATRWDESVTAGKGTFYDNIVQRILGDYTGPFTLIADTPLLGHGVGVGTLAGSRLMTGTTSFLLSESEPSRIVLELGPILGFAFIGWRLWLASSLVFGGWKKLRATGEPLSWLIGGATFMSVAFGQWGSSTQLGFAIFGAGLALAARNEPSIETAIEEVELEAEAESEADEEAPLKA